MRSDVNYIRRITFNVARVSDKSPTSLLLAQPLLGGSPPLGAGAQKIAGFVDREGGSFFQEWSALFVQVEESGGRVCFYYPRLSPTRSGQSAAYESETKFAIQEPIAVIAMHASFVAMPSQDENDGEVVMCYRSYFPAEMSAVY